MLTKKHFESTAEIIKRLNDPDVRRIAAAEAAKYFAKENPRFNKERFLAACGLN